LRQARSAIAQAGAARIAPRLLDEKAAALRPPTGPVVTKSMAPTGLADRVATTAPPPSAARPDASGHTGVPMGRQAAATGAGTTDDAAAGATTGDRPGPAQGDVYLDGTLMGRWMSRTLAAEAGRPANGSAGFDPRRNVFPTGAMIGG
jgi:hypothetical protein